MMGTYIHRKVKEEVKEDLEWNYQLFPILKERKHQRAGTLSGGEQQMLTIGRAIMGRPKLLLLDEPSVGLASHLKDEIFGKFKEMNQRGLTLFIVEQEILLSLGISERGYLLRNGRLIKEGSASALIENKDLKAFCFPFPS
jgi:branched-chain amino acid transport system ATP-binding protein